MADVTPPDLRALYPMAGPADLEALFRAIPPAAILTGFDPVLERPLVDYARRYGYRPLPLPTLRDRYGQGTLWRPTTTDYPPTLTGERP